ncbi:MAG: hypothetical protein ACT4P3_18475 [Betaproteobacteria bacterium]
MLGSLKTLMGESRQAPAKREPAPAWVAVKGFEFPLARHLSTREDYPIVVSSLEPHLARATVAFVGRTGRRIGAVLQGLAETAPWGKDILVVFDDEETYYRYLSYYYPETGEFAFSGGMHLGAGCGHFVTVKRDMRALEATIVHEMTHAALGHLTLPRWLDEGLAVNTERRLAGMPPRQVGELDKLHEKLRRFWSVVSIQEFWSGESRSRRAGRGRRRRRRARAPRPRPRRSRHGAARARDAEVLVARRARTRSRGSRRCSSSRR